MTTPVALKDPAAAKDTRKDAKQIDVEPEPSPAKGDGGPGSPAMAGLSTGKGSAKRTAIDFVPWWTESVSWSKDVAAAIKDHPRYIEQVDTAMARIAELAIPLALKKSLGEDLVAVRKSLTDLLAERIASEKRAAAIATINAAPALIKKAEDAASSAETQQREEAEKARLEQVAKKQKEEDDARAADERKKQTEAAEAKKKEEEAAAAKAAEDKKREEAEAQKKADEDKARAAAEEKKKADEAEAKRKADEAAAALKKQEEAAAAALKKQQAEQAALERKNAFGDREGAHAASAKVATETAAASYKTRVEEAQQAHDQDHKKLPAEPRIKGKGPSKAQQRTIDERAQKESELTKTLEGATADAKNAQEAQEDKLLDHFASVAKSASGKQLNDADLSWVITASGGKAALAQALADVAALGGMALAKSVAAQKDPAALAGACAELLTAKFPVAHVIAAAQLLLQSPGVMRPWLLGLAGRDDVEEALEFAHDYTKALPTVVKVQPILGQSGDARDFVDAMVTIKASATDIDWLLTLSTGGAAFEALCRTIRNNSVPLTAVKAFHQAAGANFTLAEVAAMVEFNRQRLGAATLAVAEADPHTPSYVGLRCDMSGTPTAEMKAALRGEALLRDAATAPAGFAAAVYQYDARYFGGPAYREANIANGARTGFIRLTFPTGPTFDVHTHWNSISKNRGLISSMHVQDASGHNGAELEKWPLYFAKLAKAVVDAHNAATGLSAPTGGKLSLP